MTEQLKRRATLQSKAKRIRTLQTKQKKLFKNYYKATDFEGPTLELMRRNGRAEFYERATKGEFNFKHSDGTERKILLDPSQAYDIQYLNKYTKKYYCHEDYALPLPHNALLTVQQLGAHETQVLASANEFATKLERAKGATLKQWVTMVAVVVAGIILYVVLKPEDAPALTQVASNALAGNFSLG